jgi:hypothetical protein
LDVIAHLIELKPDSSQRVEDWARYLHEHRAAAVETLNAEGVAIESWFGLELNGKQYLLCYMRTESIQRAQEVAQDSTSPVDAYHRQFASETWVKSGRVRAKLLVDLVEDD